MSNLATIVNNILADSGIDDINVVVTTGSYANPAWITSLAWTKITGAPLGDYLPLAGGTMTGNINWAQTDRGLTWVFNSDGASIKFYNTGDGDTDSRLEFATLDNNDEYFRWGHIPSGGSFYESMRLRPVSSGNAELIVTGKIIKSGGTSSQYLMADGSVSTLTNPVTGTGTTGAIPKWTSASAIGNSIISESASLIEINGSTRTLGTFISTSGGTERYIQMLGYSSAYATIRSNVGFNSSYNSLAFIVNTNSNESNQGNATIPSWQMVLGGSLPDTDSFYIQRSTAGSFTFSTLLKLSSTGTLTLNSYGTGSKTGTVAYNLAVDSSGNVIETAGGVVDGSGTASYVPKWQDANTLTNSIIYDSGTKIGISIATPRTKMEINGGLPTSIPTRTNTTNGIAVTDGGAIYGRIGVADLSASGAGYPTYIQAGDWDGANYYNLLLNPLGGFVGVGVTNPTGELHIYGSQPAFRIQSSVSGNMQFGQWDTTTNRIQSSGRNFYLIGTDAYDTIFATNNTERVRILSNGFVGINENAPGSRLVVTDTNQFIARFYNIVADQLTSIQVANAAQSTAGVNNAAATVELVGKAGVSTHGRHGWIGAEGVASETFRTKILFKARGESNSGYTWSGATEAPTILSLDGNGFVGVNTKSPAEALDVYGNTIIRGMSGSQLNIRGDESLNSNFGITWTTPTFTGGLAAIRVARRGATDASDMMFFTAPNGDIPTERLRITNTANVISQGSNIILGTNNNTNFNSTNAYTLYIANAGAEGEVAQGQIAFGEVNNYGINTTRIGAAITTYFAASYGRLGLVFKTKNTSNDAGPTEKMRLTDSGILGLGVVPSAWNLSTVFQIGGNNAAINFSGNAAILGIVNAFYNGSSYIVQNTGEQASFEYGLARGAAFNWRMGASAAAGSTTPLGLVMSLSSSGNLSIGNTNNTYKLDVTGTGRFTSNLTSEGILYTTGGGTERQHQMLGYNSAYSVIRTNVGFNGNYNSLGFIVNSNDANNAQGNAALPSWFMDLGGNTPNEDSVIISRSAPGSFSPTRLFKVTNVGDGIFKSTVYASSATANAGSPSAAFFSSGNDGGTIWKGAITAVHNADVTINAGASIGLTLQPLASTGSSFYGAAKVVAERPNATANNQDTDLVFWTRAGASNSTTDSEKMRITSIGRFGFGQGSPRTRAEFVVGLPTSIPTHTNTTNGIVVTDGGDIYGKIGVANFSASSAGYPTYIQAGDWSGAVYYNLLLNSLGGNVAIGNNTPLTKLHVNNAVVGAILPYINGTGLSYNNDGISVAGSNTNNTNIGNGLTLYNNVSSVNAYAPVIAFSSLASSGAYNSTYAFITGQYKGNGGDFNWAAGELIFGTANAYGAQERMRLNRVGFLGVGSTDPTAQLHVYDGSYNRYTIRISTTAANISNAYGGIGFSGEESNTKGAIFFQSIGQSYSRGRMIFALNNVEDQSSATPSNAVLTLANNGAATFVSSVTATSFFESSDIRFKQVLNIHNGQDFGAIEYRWVDARDSKLHWGYSAQEVMKFLPDAVAENEDGFLTLDYNQAHTYKIAMLEKRIAELEQQLKNK